MATTYECPLVRSFDLHGEGWEHFADNDNLDWSEMTSELQKIIESDEFRGNKLGAHRKLVRLYEKYVDDLNQQGCGWFAGFVVGALAASKLSK